MCPHIDNGLAIQVDIAFLGMENPGPKAILILYLVSEKGDCSAALVRPSIRAKLYVQPSVGPLEVIFCEPLYVGWTICAGV